MKSFILAALAFIALFESFVASARDSYGHGQRGGYYRGQHFKGFPRGRQYYSTGFDHSGHGDVSYDKGSKEICLKDLFDIALTTLAFLSFGMFILQVLMCITMSKSDNGSLMMMPMEVEEVNPEAEGVRRKRRSTELLTLIQINEISRKVLQPIDAVLIANIDNGKCLRNVICENNKYSRELNNNQKLWIPGWGLGLSWLSSRVTPAKSYTSILESLKTSAFELGRADCLKLFPCDINLQRKLHKKRRQAREASNHIFEWDI